MLIIIIITILIISFVFAWRALGELEIPKEAYRAIEGKVNSVRKWSTIVFLKGRQIFYKANEEKKRI